MNISIQRGNQGNSYCQNWHHLSAQKVVSVSENATNTPCNMILYYEKTLAILSYPTNSASARVWRSVWWTGSPVFTRRWDAWVCSCRGKIFFNVINIFLIKKGEKKKNDINAFRHWKSNIEGRSGYIAAVGNSHWPFYLLTVTVLSNKPLSAGTFVLMLNLGARTKVFTGIWLTRVLLWRRKRFKVSLNDFSLHQNACS